jgi:excisionase family DNA binding protein
MMLTVVEVAARLRMSRTSVYQLVESGKLGCHRIGIKRGAIRISEEDLASFLDTCRVVAPARASVPSEPVQLKHLTQ